VKIFGATDEFTCPEISGWGIVDWIGVPLDWAYRLVSPLLDKVLNKAHKKLEKKFGKAKVEIALKHANIVKDESLKALDTITSYGYKWVSDQFDQLLDELLKTEDGEESDSASVTKEDVTNCLAATKKNLWDDRRKATRWTYGLMLHYKLNGWYFTKYLFQLLGAALKFPFQLVGLDQYLPEMPQFKMPKFTATPWNASDPDAEKDKAKGVFQRIKSSPTTKYVAGATVVAGLGALYFWKPIWRKMKSLFGSGESSAPAQDTMTPVSTPAANQEVSRSADPISYLQDSTGMEPMTILAIVIGVISVLLILTCVVCRGRRSGGYDDYSRDREYDIEEGSRKRKSRLPSFWPKRSGGSYQPSGTPCSDRYPSRRDEFISFA